jgi:hypothetical protein
MNAFPPPASDASGLPERMAMHPPNESWKRRTGTTGPCPSAPLATAFAFALVLASPGPVDALPAFSRAHNLGCGACHTLPPRLNAYGRAFRERGYVVPGLPPRAERPPAGNPEDHLSVWFRGSFVERSDFNPGDDRTIGRVPNKLDAYLLVPLPGRSSIFIDAGVRFDHIASDGPGPRTFSTSTQPLLRRGFLMMDLGHLFAGSVDPNRRGVGYGPTLTLGRFAPSTLTSYATPRQILHEIPGDTEQSPQGSSIRRFPLTAYAMGARYFGIFGRDGQVILPTTPSLIHTSGNLGVGIHGRLGEPLLYGVGFLNGAAPDFPHRGDTLDPYGLLRYDLGSGATSCSVSLVASYGPDTVQVRYTAAEAADGIAGQETLDWLRFAVAAQVTRRRIEVYGTIAYDEIFGIPAAIENDFETRSLGLTLEVDYRLPHALLASVRYDWMDPGGYRSSLSGLDAPRTSHVLAFQLRWFLLEGWTRWSSAPGLVSLTLRDSVNLSAGSGHPFRSWRNTFVLGIDVAL